jgi:tetratricopeptide (TPR) repeat protein
MAFGLGFNKAKSLSAAEKSVMQGKIPAAIQEYQKILEHEPRDLVVLNTVGDLLLRISKTAEALPYFYKLGEAYVEDGFVRNGIAVYKKINRSDPTAIEAICRLADLYTVQGQLSDARGYLNQAVEYYSARGETAKCVELFEKLLLMDPENAAAKQKLATVYEQVGRKDEAAAMFFSAAEGFADRANPGEAEKVLKKARDLGYNSGEVTVLQARVHIDAGRGPEAVALLIAIPDLESNRGALNLLFHAYMTAGDPGAAGHVATTIFQKFEDFAGVEQVGAIFVEGGDTAQALALYESVADAAIQHRQTQPLAEGLRNVLAQDRDNEQAYQLQRRIYKASGENGAFVDASDQLAEALARRGEYAAARDVYAELLQLEPNHPMHKQRMQQMAMRSGGGPAGAAAASPDAPAFTLGMPGDSGALIPSSDFDLGAALNDPHSQGIVESALAEADHQATFLQTDEAIATLHNALEQLPGNVVLNQKLIEICEQAQRWSEAVAACGALAEAFVMAGDGENAARYSDLQARYQAISDGGAIPPSSAHDSPAPEFEMPEATPFDMPASSLVSPGFDSTGFDSPGFDSPGAPEFPGVAEFAIPDAMPMDIAEMKTPAAAPEVTISLPPEFTTDVVVGSGTGTHEVDLSGEWETLMASDGERLAEEVASHLSAGRVSEASLALEMLRATAPDDPRLNELESQVQQAVLGDAPAEPAPEPVAAPVPELAPEMADIPDFSEFQMPSEMVPETSVSPLEWPSEPAAFEFPVDAPMEEAIAPPVIEAAPVFEAPPVIAPQPVATPPPAPAPQVVSAVAFPPHEDEFELDLESPAGPAADDFVLELEEPTFHPTPAPPAPAPVAFAPPPPPVAPAPVKPAPASPPLSMADLLGTVEASLNDLVPPAAKAAPPLAAKPAPPPAREPAHEPVKKAPARTPAAPSSGGLADVFADFKQEMEQDSAVDSDVENHYNMGMAFKEMGLYDEAIGEFQKAFHGAESAPAHPNFIPVCSLLAHCFMEKNLPELAVTWLQKALKAPGLDREGEMALRYEIGSAQEAAGQKAAAMESFMLVYALNIDYRDVADRIRSLKGN